MLALAQHLVAPAQAQLAVKAKCCCSRIHHRSDVCSGQVPHQAPAPAPAALQLQLHPAPQLLILLKLQEFRRRSSHRPLHLHLHLHRQPPMRLLYREPMLLVLLLLAMLLPLQLDLRLELGRDFRYGTTTRLVLGPQQSICMPRRT